MNKEDDCPICYEIIAPGKNRVSTVCGHSFHTNCLLRHTAFNGYGCPCCRTQLVEEPPTEDSSSAEDDNSGFFVADDNGGFLTEEDTISHYDQYVLDGCRWMFQRAKGEDIHDTDPYTDSFEQWSLQMAKNCIDYEKEMGRKTECVMNELGKMKNAFSYEDLVKGYLYWNGADFCDSSKYEFHNRKVTSTLKSVLERLGLAHTQEQTTFFR